MKLRRAMAAAAATAVIAPVALLAAPAAYATGDTSSSPTATVSESAPSTDAPSTDAPSTDTPPPSQSTSETTPPASASPTGSPTGSPSTSAPAPSTSAPTSPAPSTSAPEESETPDPDAVCEDTKVDIGISGLPGKIAVGSGWHEFSLNVANNSDSTLENLEYLAGASSDQDGMELFESKKVSLQAYNPQDKVWEDLNELGYAVGYVGYSEKLAPDYQVDIPLRINVKSDAPVGAGFTLGATIYGDTDGKCVGFGDVAYKFQIVAAGTDTEGTKPQEGGKAPVADQNQKPATDTPEVTGSLAETGSSSALPMIGLLGGLAVVAGGGAVFAVRRRKAGAEA